MVLKRSGSSSTSLPFELFEKVALEDKVTLSLASLQLRSLNIKESFTF